MTAIVKLGGSLVTEKDERETVDVDALATASDHIAEADVSNLVLVHGGGSFGHKHAAEHGVSSRVGTTDPEAIRSIHDAMGRLQSVVLDYLHDRRVPAVPVRPFSLGFRPGPGGVSMATEQLDAMLGEGFVPVLHGDVFTTRTEGATIVSGDELVVQLATDLDADRVGLCGSVPGVLDDDGSVISEIDSFETVAAILGGSDATDVTGGMAAKVELLLDAGRPAHVFDLDGLREFLDGGEPGTTIRGDR